MGDMIFRDIKRAHNFEVENWIIRECGLTKEQASALKNSEAVRFSPFDFYKEKERTVGRWFRLTLLVFPLVWLALLIFMVPKFIVTGKWGYDKRMEWFGRWGKKLGL